jgi:hypothetical protein
MKKIVINVCFGGFGLSPEAEDLYAEKSGFKVYRYTQTKYEFRDGSDLYERYNGGGSIMFYHTVKKDLGDSFVGFPNYDDYWSSRDIKRDDPILIEVVEQLGDKASGGCAVLRIVEIPDDVEWTIEEYDGNEHIAEKHNTWR